MILLIADLVLFVSAYTGNGATIVYVTNTGSKYHVLSCGYLSSVNKIHLEDAIIKGYTPCSRCSPPIYTGSAEPESYKETSDRWNDSHTSGSSKKETTRKTEVTEIAKATDPTTTTAKSTVKSTKEDNTTSWIILSVLAALIVIPFVFSIGYALVEFFRKPNELKKVVSESKTKGAEFQRKLNNTKFIFDTELISLISRLDKLKSKEEVSGQVMELVAKSETKELNEILQQHNATIDDNGYVHDKRRSTSMRNECFVSYSPYSSAYHLLSCVRRGPIRCHVLDIPKKLRPCKICHPEKIDTSWMTKSRELYYTIMREQEEMRQALILTSRENSKKNSMVLNNLLFEVSGNIVFSETKVKGKRYNNKFCEYLADLFAVRVKANVLDLQSQIWRINPQYETFGKYLYVEDWIVRDRKEKKKVKKHLHKRTDSIYVIVNHGKNNRTTEEIVSFLQWKEKKTHIESFNSSAELS